MAFDLDRWRLMAAPQRVGMVQYMAATFDAHIAHADPGGSTDSGRNLAPDQIPAVVHAVVFDLGNVLITWDPFPALAKAVGERQAAIFLSDQDFDFMAWNQAQDAGRSWGEGEEVAVASHPQWESAIRGYRENFPYSLVGAIQDTVDILRELHAAGIRLYALTNWSRELFPLALDRFDFLDLFEDIIVSGQEGVAKPDPAIFTILRERIGHQLGDCIFIDDSARNISVAREAGLDAILFTDTGHLRGDLLSRGLPVSRT